MLKQIETLFHTLDDVQVQIILWKRWTFYIASLYLKLYLHVIIKWITVLYNKVVILCLGQYVLVHFVQVMNMYTSSTWLVEFSCYKSFINTENFQSEIPDQLITTIWSWSFPHSEYGRCHTALLQRKLGFSCSRTTFYVIPLKMPHFNTTQRLNYYEVEVCRVTILFSVYNPSRTLPNLARTEDIIYTGRLSEGVDDDILTL
jgi:hypothetical protein